MMLANPEPMFDPNPLGDHHASQVAPNCYPLQPSDPMQCQDDAFASGFAQKREIAPRTASIAASDTKETETAKSPTAIQIDNQAGNEEFAQRKPLLMLIAFGRFETSKSQYVGRF